MYEAALLPSLEWYLLPAGLLTRAVLEGYLSAGWRGRQTCLLLVVLGINEGAGEDKDGRESEEDEDAEFSEF